MKKALCFCLIFCILLPLLGCAKEDSPAVNHIDFYYLKTKLPYGEPDSMFGKQSIEQPENTEDILSVLSAYFQTPSDPLLTNPFPTGTTIIRFQTEGDTAIILLSGLTLSGMTKTLACACLTLTVCHITGAAQVQISWESEPTALPVIMSPESITLMDEGNMAIREN